MPKKLKKDNTELGLLRSAIDFLQEGEGIELGSDTFLVTGGLDGSDKCYGFIRDNGELLCVTRQCSDGYPIASMEFEDLDYIFTSGIIKKLEATGKGYKVVDADDI